MDARSAGLFVKHVGVGPLAWERAGLGWLDAAPSGPRIVQVLDHTETSLTLERLRPTEPTRADAESFGRALADLHASGAPAFGAAPPGWRGDGWVGRATLPLANHASWGEFYAVERIGPYLATNRDAGLLDPADISLLERVASRLADQQFDDHRRPARLHGDLWSGNVIWTTVGATLIDPAAHGGHGETDLAMLALFGLPHLAIVQAAYAEAVGLDAEWRARIGLHQIHPLLVHVTLFGAGYVPALRAAARPYA
ncbi:MAG: fructosamine kinase family protein [Propioniciclava sp.]